EGGRDAVNTATQRRGGELGHPATQAGGAEDGGAVLEGDRARGRRLARDAGGDGGGERHRLAEDARVERGDQRRRVGQGGDRPGQRGRDAPVVVGRVVVDGGEGVGAPAQGRGREA